MEKHYGKCLCGRICKEKGITVAEAMQHAIVKEYLKYHPDDSPKENPIIETKIVAGCGCATEG